MRAVISFSRLLTQIPTRMTTPRTPQQIRLLSWNIDMDTAPISARTQAILNQIREHNPDVVMLQEVTDTSYKVLRVLWNPSKQSKNPKYKLHVDNSWPEELPYFPLLLTRENLMKEDETIAERFVTSVMHRGYIIAKGKLKNGVDTMFVTSHLESLKERSAERKNQLAQVLEMIREHVDNGGAGLFAGDTNLREAEVPAREIEKKAGDGNTNKKRPHREKFVDAWLQGGGKDEHKFTWDTQKNDNLEMNIAFKPKARYDRAFLLPSARITAKEFKTIGKERLACGVFASDHWGICIDLSLT